MECDMVQQVIDREIHKAEQTLPTLEKQIIEAAQQHNYVEIRQLIEQRAYHIGWRDALRALHTALDTSIRPGDVQQRLAELELDVQLDNLRQELAR